MSQFYPVYEVLNHGGLYGAPGYPYWIVLDDPVLIAKLQAQGTIGKAYPDRLPYLPPYDEAKPDTIAVLSDDEETAIVFDVNLATEEELQSIPGVGKATATAIVANRPYAALEELRALSTRVDWDSVLIYLTVGGG